MMASARVLGSEPLTETALGFCGGGSVIDWLFSGWLRTGTRLLSVIITFFLVGYGVCLVGLAGFPAEKARQNLLSQLGREVTEWVFGADEVLRPERIHGERPVHRAKQGVVAVLVDQAG